MQTWKLTYDDKTTRTYEASDLREVLAMRSDLDYFKDDTIGKTDNHLVKAERIEG